MDKLTSKGRGRPRKIAQLPHAVAEGESASNVIARHWQDGADRSTAQEEPIGADWDALVSALVGNTSHRTSAAMAYFPDAPQGMIQTPTGWVRVVDGEPGFTLNTGETIRI